MAGLQTGGFNLSVMPQFQPLDPRLFQGLTAERATESFRRGLGLADELQDRPQVRALQDLLRQLQQAEGESKLGLIPAVTEQTRAQIADSMKELETAPARRAQEAAAREQAAANAQLQQQTLAARLKAQQEEEALGLRQDEEGFRLAQQLTNLLPVLDRGIGTDEMSDEFLAIAENAPLRNALSGIAPFITGGLMRGRELAEPARDMAKTKGRGAASDADLPEDIRNMKVGESRPIPDPSDPNKRIGVLVRTPDGTQIRWDSNVGLGTEEFLMRRRMQEAYSNALKVGVTQEADEAFEDFEKRVAEAVLRASEGVGVGGFFNPTPAVPTPRPAANPTPATPAAKPAEDVITIDFITGKPLR
jgi:hypothetical protein